MVIHLPAGDFIPGPTSGGGGGCGCLLVLWIIGLAWQIPYWILILFGLVEKPKDMTPTDVFIALLLVSALLVGTFHLLRKG